jgi:hypothetical protein
LGLQTSGAAKYQKLNEFSYAGYRNPSAVDGEVPVVLRVT